MRHKDVLDLLKALFQGFSCHPDLCTDLSNIISRSGFEAKFLSLLLIRLKYLQSNGKNAINYPEGFEALRHSENLYSMRLSGKGFNIRILYTFLSDHMPLLLLGFEEKSGKKRTDYTSYIPVAEERIRNVIGGESQ